MMKTGFEILLVDETECEYLVAEILFGGQRLCQVSRERGPEDLEISFLDDLYVLPEVVKMRFSLTEFEEQLRLARRALTG